MAIITPLKKLFNWQLAHERIEEWAPLNGAGTPAVTGTNSKSIGQIYVDTAASKAYIAKSVTNTPATDWMILN